MPSRRSGGWFCVRAPEEEGSSCPFANRPLHWIHPAHPRGTHSNRSSRRVRGALYSAQGRPTTSTVPPAMTAPRPVNEPRMANAEQGQRSLVRRRRYGAVQARLFMDRAIERPLEGNFVGSHHHRGIWERSAAADRERPPRGHQRLRQLPIFDWLLTHSNPPSYDSGCGGWPMGLTYGWRFMSGASYNTVRNSQATGLNLGIWLGPGSHHNKVLNNVLTDNNMKDSDPNSDGGAVAVAVHGDDNEVAFNQISGSDACSRQHGRDGAAFDIYGGQRNSIHNNIARQNLNFMEVGNSRAADNTLAYNLVTSTLTSANFAIARGSGDVWGPTYRTRMYNNTVYLTGSSSIAVSCYGGCNAGVMTFKNNIVWDQDRVGYVDSSWDEGNNIWWSPGGPKIWFTESSSSKNADPRFVNAAGGDFHLAAGSPAIDAGTSESITRGYTKDLDGNTAPNGSAVDIGAYEKGATAPAPPPPSLTYIARDAFGRTATDTWGSADIGGAWSRIGTTADFDVNGVEGTARVSGPSQMRLGVPVVSSRA